MHRKICVRSPLSSECSLRYIMIPAPPISHNNECDLVISRFVCPPWPAAPLWIPPPYTGVLAQCNEIITSLVGKRVYLAKGAACSFSWSASKEAFKLKKNSIVQLGEDKLIQIITRPVGKHVEFPQFLFTEPDLHPKKEQHHKQISYVPTSENCGTMKWNARHGHNIKHKKLNIRIINIRTSWLLIKL